MINYVDDENEPEWKGYFYATLIFVAAVLQSILLNQYFFRCYVVGMRIRTAVISAIYRKVMKCTITCMFHLFFSFFRPFFSVALLVVPALWGK